MASHHVNVSNGKRRLLKKTTTKRDKRPRHERGNVVRTPAVASGSSAVPVERRRLRHSSGILTHNDIQLDLISPTRPSREMSLDHMPVEIINHILTYLEHPRSRLAGRTQWLSAYDCPSDVRKTAKQDFRTNPTAPPDMDRFGVDLFSWPMLRHPFNVLAVTSTRFRTLVERYCQHRVITHNRFNLLISESEENGPVFPGLSDIVYRRLWLQYAPRSCVFCNRPISDYPHHKSIRLFVSCLECFYDQVYTLSEVESQYHLSWLDIQAHNLRTSSRFFNWLLRDDVEALALRLYGTKAYHDPHNERQPCRICARSGTLSRIADIRARCAESTWTEEPGTDGWIVRRASSSSTSTGMDLDGDDTASSSAGRTNTFFRFLPYHVDPYHYPRDTAVHYGYHLSAEPIA